MTSNMFKQLGRWEKLVLLLVIGMTLLRVYVASHVGLGDDEAYYWDWSKHLQLSYYDHPGMTAWMIRIGTIFFGDTSLGVRFFALVCNGATGLLIWILAKKMFNPVTGLIALSLYMLAPIFSVGGLLMVPDAPMGTAWIAAALVAWKIFAEKDDSWQTWLLLGTVLGLGLLSKYTIALLAFSLVFYMFTDRADRMKLLGEKFWAAVGISILFCLPIILWNVQYDWPTVKFHLHDRQTGGGGANFTRWTQFFVSQLILLGPALWLVCAGVWIKALTVWSDRRWRFLFALTFPTFALFAAQALFAEYKPHWPAPAYSLLLIGAAEWLRVGFNIAALRARRWTVGAVCVVIFAFFALINILFYAGALNPILPKLFRTFAPSSVAWDPKFDPTNDLYGWDQAVREARRLQDEAVAQNLPVPFLSSSRYQLAAQIAFTAHEQVWRVSPGRDQYEFWQTPEEQKKILGRSSIYITDNRFERDPRNDHIFEECKLASRLRVHRGIELARRFDIWACRGFLGTR